MLPDQPQLFSYTSVTQRLKKGCETPSHARNQLIIHCQIKKVSISKPLQVSSRYPSCPGSQKPYTECPLQSNLAKLRNHPQIRHAEDYIQVLTKSPPAQLNVHWASIISHIVGSELLFQLVRYETFVVVEVLLDVNLELDDIVEHSVNLGVEFFP